jgi:hypothetical protein
MNDPIIAQEEIHDSSKGRKPETLAPKKSLLAAYKEILQQQKSQQPQASAQIKKIEMALDQVSLSSEYRTPVSAPLAPEKPVPPNKQSQMAKGGKMASMVATKKLIAKSAEMYFNIDNPLTFNHLSMDVEKMMEDLMKKMGVANEKVMDAKLEGKHITTARVFESLAVMIVAEPLIGGGRNKKTKRSYQTKLKDFKAKLSLLGFDLDDRHLSESAMACGQDFIDMLKDRLREVDMRLTNLLEYQEGMKTRRIL